MRRSVLVLVAISACAHAAPTRAFADEGPPADQTRRYTIWLGGARVGTATETEVWSARGVTLTRVEAMTFLRGDAPVAMTTTIEVIADRQLVPLRTTWIEQGAQTRTAVATHEANGWMVQLDHGGLTITGDAVPAELIPLLVRRDGRFAGPMFLPARGFVTGHGTYEPIAPQRLVARLALDAGPQAEATIDLDRDGAPARVVDGEGVIAMRATPAQAQERFALVDLVAATSIPLAGVRQRDSRLALVGAQRLPALPGQQASRDRPGVELALSAGLPGALSPGIAGRDRTRDIVTLVAAVRSTIAPDLGASVARPDDAAHATAGDCTTFALAYAALATRRGIPTRIVTGLRVDGERLARHRWAVSWTGRAWIAVDAAFGTAPAGGDLVGLAIHDADDAGLIAGEAALTQIRTARWIR